MVGGGGDNIQGDNVETNGFALLLCEFNFPYSLQLLEIGRLLGMEYLWNCLHYIFVTMYFIYDLSHVPAAC